MSFDYFEDLEDFELWADSEGGPGKAREDILSTLSDRDLEIPASDLSEAELQAMPGHVLFAFQYDSDLSLSFYAVPEDKLSEPLRAAMKAASGYAYAYHELSLGDEQARAFIRLDAAAGLEDFDEYIEEFDGSMDGFSKTIAESDRNCLEPFRVAYFEDEKDPVVAEGALDKRFVAAYSVRRAQ